MKIKNLTLFIINSPGGSHKILCELRNAEWDMILFRKAGSSMTSSLKESLLYYITPVSNVEYMKRVLDRFKRRNKVNRK